MSTLNVRTKLERLQRIGAPPKGVPLCMLPDPHGFYDAWSEALEETETAWLAWRAAPTLQTYSAYRAAADREDCAQAWLARHHGGDRLISRRGS
jgi:hypothetical protein